jgi:hypothetical protein
MLLLVIAKESVVNTANRQGITARAEVCGGEACGVRPLPIEW